jgi:hypothetical protein
MKNLILFFLITSSLNSISQSKKEREIYFRCEIDRSFGDFRDFKEEFFFHYPLKDSKHEIKANLRFFTWNLEIKKNGLLSLQGSDKSTGKELSFSMKGVIPTQFEEVELILESYLDEKKKKLKVKLSCAPENKS